MIPEFKEWPKIARLNRNIIITEKIDGTNGVIHISEDGLDMSIGSRTRWLNERRDNFSFHLWATHNKTELLKLGPGYHYGEWWGLGIQRGYGLLERRFSLFNVSRWNDEAIRPACCNVVPILYSGIFDTDIINKVLQELKESGSKAVSLYMKPEGVVIYHTASHQLFKKTIDNDEGKIEVKE